MRDVDKKDDPEKKRAREQDERRRRDDANEPAGAGDGTNLLPWDADVEDFMVRLDRALNDFRTAMTSTEFRGVVTDYRYLSLMEKRAVSNRLQKRGLANLVRALHTGDFRVYTDGWQAEAEAQREQRDGPRGDAP